MLAENLSDRNCYFESKSMGTIYDFEDEIYKITLGLILIGIVSNLMCVFVYLQKKMLKNKFNWYLLVSAILNLFVSLILFIDYVFRFLSPLHILLRDFHKIFEIIIYFCTSTTDSCLTFFYLILSIDRLYCAIKGIRKIKTFLTQLHAKSFIITTLLVLIVTKVVDFFLCNSIVDENIKTSYCSLASPILFNIAPTILILFVNLILIKKIVFNCKRNERFVSVGEINTLYESNPELGVLKNLNARKSHNLIIISLSFWLILTTISFTFSSYYFIFPFDYISKHKNDDLVMLNEKKINFDRIKTISNIQAISSIFLYSNHCINFFVYIFYDPIFKNCFKKMLSVKLKKIIFNKKTEENNHVVAL